MARLGVFADQRPMGWFGFEIGLFFFEYTPEWLALSSRFVLAPQFPLDGTRFTGAKVKFFFQNLLPEGPVLEAIAHEKQLELSNLFQLLAVLGRDCAGALSLLPEGEMPPSTQDYKPLTLADLRSRIANRAYRPLIASNAESSMSLAGVQDKMGVRFDAQSGRLWEPIAGTPSTHILKPENRSPMYPAAVLNEYLCMRLAKRLGLNVPAVWLLRVPDPVLLVQRYDREELDGHLVRHHQIDFCQLLDMDGFFKYERNSAMIRLQNLFAAASDFVEPAKARLALVDWVLFNYLIGNADAHAKNLSALVSSDGLRLAPFYDLLCVKAYWDERLALFIGDAECLDDVTSNEWEAFSADCGLSFPALKTRLGQLAGRMLPAFDKEASLLTDLNEDESRLLVCIRTVIEQHARFAKQALAPA
jgi:serine/threonine-protein kinase HipA